MNTITSEQNGAKKKLRQGVAIFDELCIARIQDLSTQKREQRNKHTIKMLYHPLFSVLLL